LRDKHYLARKARMGWSSAEMFASYRLAQSIGVVSMTKKALRVGTDLKYARALQWGRAGKNRPRMFIGLDQTAQQQCVEELNAHVNKALDKLAQRISSDKSEAA
jgi:phage gpG-like protein